MPDSRSVIKGESGGQVSFSMTEKPVRREGGKVQPVMSVWLEQPKEMLHQITSLYRKHLQKIYLSTYIINNIL